jgi:hypothetical protein
MKRGKHRATRFILFKLKFAWSGITVSFSVKRLLSSVCINSYLSPQLLPFCFQGSKYLNIKGKVKFTLEQATKPKKGEEVLLYSFFYHGTRRGMSNQRHAQAALPLGRNTASIVQDAECAPGQIWKCAEKFASREFDPWIVQPVATCYTDCAIPAKKSNYSIIKSK